MKRTELKRRRVLPVIAVAGAALAVAPAAAHAQAKPAAARSTTVSAVYTETNSTAGNAVHVFRRSPSGELTDSGSYATGGTGTGVGLGSGHSVIASSSGQTVLAVNAGSNSVSAFAVDDEGLRRLGQAVPSGGTTPTSVTISGDLVYVMNAGSGTISGFHLDGQAGLLPIPGSTQPLAAAGTGTDSQIQFDQTGHVLIVDERASSQIQTFIISADGAAHPAQTVTSDAGGPFGFDVDESGHVLFSDVAIGTSSGASSYNVADNGTLIENGMPVATGQAAACWLAAVGNYAYTDNAGSGSISRFAVAPGGQLELTGNTVISPTAHPLDMAGADGKFLYVLADGLHQIIGYRVTDDGSMHKVTEVAVPAGAIGLGAH